MLFISKRQKYSHVNLMKDKNDNNIDNDDVIPYGEQLHATSSVLTYDGRTANFSPGESSSGRPWVSVHTADLLSHAPV